MASESSEPPDMNKGGDSPSKPDAPACKEILDCGGKEALEEPIILAQVTSSVKPKVDVQDDSFMKTAAVGDIPGKSEIVVDTTADNSPHIDVGIRHPGPAWIHKVAGKRGLMGGPGGGSSVAEDDEEMTMKNTGKRPMSDQEMPSSSNQVPNPRPSQGEFGKILQISQWSLAHRIKVCEILQDPEQHWRMSIQSSHEYARQSDAIVAPGRLTRIEPLREPPHPLQGFDPRNWQSNLEKLEVEMEKSCFQHWTELSKYLKIKLKTLREDDEKEGWYDACKEKGFQAQEIFQAVEKGEMEPFKDMMGKIGMKHWALCPVEYRGATLLHWAALHGQEDMVSFMLDELQNWKGSADGVVNAHDAFGFTPFLMALFPTLWFTYKYPEEPLEYVDMGRRKLSKSCSRMMSSLFGMGAALGAEISLHYSFVVVTADIGDDSRAYFVASSYHDMVSGMHPTPGIGDDSRAYFVASAFRDMDGGMYSTRGIEDDSRVHFEAPYSRVADMPYYRGADNSMHPLVLAVWIAHPSLMDIFIENWQQKAFEQTTVLGENILHLAAMGVSDDFLETGRVMVHLLNHLRQCDASSLFVNLQNIAKETPLHIAVARGNCECVAALLKFPGIVRDTPNKNGQTPLHFARKLKEMSTKTGVIRDAVDLCREHSRKFRIGVWVDQKYDMPMSNFRHKGRLSRGNYDDIATKIFSSMVDNRTKHQELWEICKHSNRLCDIQLWKILQMSQWSLTRKINVCKMLQFPSVRSMLDTFTRSEYAKQSLSSITAPKLNVQSTLFSSLTGEGSQQEQEQAWKELALLLEHEQDNLRNTDRHKDWYKAFEGKAFKPHEIFEAIELNVFALADWMMKQVTRSLLEKDNMGITPGEYRGATPLHWAALHGRRLNMVDLMVDPTLKFKHTTKEAKKLEDGAKAMLRNQDEFGFTPIHMIILSSFMDECFPDRDPTNLDLSLYPNICEHANICGAFKKPLLFKRKDDEPQHFKKKDDKPRRFKRKDDKPQHFEKKDVIQNCDRTIFGANDMLSPIELAIIIAKHHVVEDMLDSFPNAFVKSSDEDTLLHFAARNINNDATAMNSVLRHLHLHPDILNSRNNDGDTPLHIAVREGKDALVATLLRCHYIKVDIPNKSGLIPLEYADRNAYIKVLIENHPQDLRHMQLLQLSQWSLRHRILAIQMFVENATKLEKIKDTYLKQCWLIVGDDSSRTEGVAELTDIVSKLREEVQEHHYDSGVWKLQESVISVIEEGDYPVNTLSDEKQYESRNKLELLLQRHHPRQVLECLTVDIAEYTGANWFHWAVLHGRADIVDLVCSKLKAIFTAKRLVPSYAIMKKELEDINSRNDINDQKRNFAIRDEFEARWAEFKTEWSEIVDKRDRFGFTPLHLVAFSFSRRRDHTYIDEVGTQNDVELVEKLCENKFPHCASRASRGSRSNFMLWNSSYDNDGNCTIYADDYFPVICDIYPIQLAIHMAHPCVVEKLLEKFPEESFVKLDSCGDTILHYAEAWNALAKRSGGQWSRIEATLLKLLDSPSNSKAVNVRNNDRDTPLHKAVRTESLEWVEALLQCEHIMFNLRDREKLTPREVALKLFKKPTHKESAKLVSRWIQQCFSNKTPPKEENEPSMKRIIELIHTYDSESMPQERETLQRERQVYVDAANAILVGAALIASASFGAWLQPPLGYQAYYSPEFQDTNPAAPPGTYESFVAIKQHWILQMFWIFNSLAFFFSLATVIAGADAAIPWQETELRKAVDSVRHAVKIASGLLGVAIVFVICTFATLGFAILPPIEKYRTNMWCTLAVGVVLCGVVLIRLLRKLVLSGSETTGSAKPTPMAQITEMSS